MKPLRADGSRAVWDAPYRGTRPGQPDQSLPKMIWHMDEPSDPIAACMFQAARLASKHVKVVLGGDGGDELFAGFDRYVGSRYIDMYSLMPLPCAKG
jgi:asparagine synthetase B (glutamine-hydrolysing)